MQALTSPAVLLTGKVDAVPVTAVAAIIDIVPVPDWHLSPIYALSSLAIILTGKGGDTSTNPAVNHSYSSAAFRCLIAALWDR